MYIEFLKTSFLGISVQVYGLFIITGILLSYLIILDEILLFFILKKEIFDFVVFCFFGGLIGGRLLFVIIDWRYFFIDDPFLKLNLLSIYIPRVFAFWEGGLVFWGSFFGGFFASLFYSLPYIRCKLRLIDLLILGLPFGQFIGRMGCFFSGCCFGKSVYHLDKAGKVINDISFFIYYSYSSVVYKSLLLTSSCKDVFIMLDTGFTLPLFPVQILEGFILSMLFVLLFFFFHFQHIHGQICFNYLFFYSCARYLIEFYRGDYYRGFLVNYLITTSQLISVLILFTLLFFLLIMEILFIRKTIKF